MDLINAKTFVKKGEIMPVEKDTKKMIVGVSFFVISVLLGILFAFISNNAINNSQWLLFSVTGTVILAIIMLNALVNPNGKWRVLSIFGFLAPMCFFAFSFLSVILILLSALIMSVFSEKINKSLFNMRKINVGQALNMGVGGVLIAVSIAISSQYFVIISKQETKEFIPKINKNVVVNNLLEKYIFKNDNGGVMTIDNFIKKFLKTGSLGNLDKFGLFTPSSTNADKKDDIKNKILSSVNSTISLAQNNMVKSVRTNISKKIDKNLTGDENVINVFTELMQAQLENTILNNALLVAIAPKFFALMLLLILLSTSAILKFPVVWIATGLFKILQFTKLFKIIKIDRKVETIIFVK